MMYRFRVFLASTAVAGFLRKLFDADDGQSLARRTLTFLVIPAWLAIHLAWAAAGIVHAVLESEWWESGAEIVGEVATEINSIAWIIFIFYFSGDHARAFADVLTRKRREKAS